MLSLNRLKAGPDQQLLLIGQDDSISLLIINRQALILLNLYRHKFRRPNRSWSRDYSLLEHNDLFGLKWFRHGLDRMIVSFVL